MGLVISKGLTLRKDYRSAFADPDVQAYLSAVEQADGQALEYPVAYAVDEFVRGCKADGIWDAIKASCILAGARTRLGALTPLVGTAPTSFNFVDDDYNRKTGLVGDGSTKYLNSNRSNNADPQNSKHLALYATSASTLLDSTYFGTEFVVGSSHISVSTPTQSSLGLRNNSSGNFWPTPNSNAIGFMGHSRASSTNVNTRANATNGAIGLTSVAPSNILLTVYARNASPLTNYSDARLAFYSVGESLDLALLDARVTDLINAFAAAIP
jgi:hypothetical protein